ncbi:phenylacetaldoxime dehydratase family protein (plasmid) [Klebsiella michiganensis]|uniref:phenylacetaldoxime dehydratase family protein n=1 Tax=Klebsiella michiganensis TaxID=1134687 RepID=UPI00265A830A|nr:phenylacetaldoxime dehydratase family protein [Klebsiella michiganensis]WKJ95776.1 phenylacetaldoxime dehydratase family protein [Klebsiella michiganensis]WKK00960.1 phenylacetaldoxime dehydratase family protein [Klebsiella michiganensis]WKK02878.1 phenylacetaldoxime dehydratase family protein [Klebsiella michiganensis]WKK07001.1 phenylacetaldoxime dehydratase family protein [Klebsiella michiganensis]
MESAIPEHLRSLRKCPSAMPEEHKPPFPAWTARFSPQTGRIVIASFGIQGRNCPDISALDEVTKRFMSADGPGHWDIASCKDQAGFYNLMAIAYWSSVEQFESWKKTSLFHIWWNSPERESEEYGFFLEIVCPQPESFETIFSDKASPEGAAWLAEGMSGELLEHGYWGSARDRLPAAQNDPLRGKGKSRSRTASGKRIVLSGRNNLCFIRSGQDWSATQQEERQKYLMEVEPVLHQGMDFLRDQGHVIGCLSCRYMQVLDPSSHSLMEKTFGLAHFADMATLELWAKSHPTHVAIFGGFMRYVKELNFNIALRLWHEIAVVPAESQYFEYVNCHPKTGLLQQDSGGSL